MGDNIVSLNFFFFQLSCGCFLVNVGGFCCSLQSDKARAILCSLLTS